MFYREWGETYDEFARIVDIARSLGIRAYLGPAYRTGHTFVHPDGRLTTTGTRTARPQGPGRRGPLCPELRGGARRPGPDHAGAGPHRELHAGAAPALGGRQPGTRGADSAPLLPVSLRVRQRRGASRASPVEWLSSLGFLSTRAPPAPRRLRDRAQRVGARGRDLGLLAEAGATSSTVRSCPLRGGNDRVLPTLTRAGINIGLGTDTYPPDMVENMKLGIQLCRMAERDPAACRAEDYYDAATHRRGGGPRPDGPRPAQSGRPGRLTSSTCPTFDWARSSTRSRP